MLYAIGLVLMLILDQLVKYWTTVNIVLDTGEAALLPGILHLANVHNTGAAFSFLQGARWFFVVLCLIFTAVVVYALVVHLIDGRLARWMAVVVLAGALGNCIDRVICGYVVDMFELDFLIFGRPFPVFNVADIYITLGAIIFCICILKDQKPAGSRRRNAAEPAADEAQPAEEFINPFADLQPKDGGAPASTATVYTQPEQAVPAVPAEEPEPAAPEATPAAAEVPAEPATEAPAEPRPDSFDLDDILAEFRDD